MRWEELTGDQFPEAVEAAGGVCLLPTSCIERHAHHLPLATDMYIARELCTRTAALEKAVVFPDFIFTQILEARCYPGTIAIDPDLILKLLENVCREIARNGLKKIVIVNAHGGNNALLPYLSQSQLVSQRDYVIYTAEPSLAPEETSTLESKWGITGLDHAGAVETSMIMVARPELVHADQIRDDGEGQPQGRLKSIMDHGVRTAIWWYGDHPTHYAGDAVPSSAEAGEYLLNAQARALAEAVRAIKADTESKRLQDEFFAKSKH